MFLIHVIRIHWFKSGDIEPTERIGRFVSQDPVFLAVTFNLADPQSMNAYAYARNNPLRYIDPTGGSWEEITDAVKGYAVGFGEGVYEAGSGIANSVTHPVETVQGTLNLYSTGISEGGKLVRALANNPTQTINEISTGYSLSYDEFASQSAFEQGRGIGNFFGKVEVAVAAAKVTSGSSAKSTSSTENNVTNNLYRPYQRKSFREAVENAAQRTPNGKFIDPNMGTVIEGKYHIGHKYGYENWRLEQQAKSMGMNQKEYNNWINNHPEWFQIEDPVSNMSHAFEKPR